jgi:hypothetical protein
MRAPTSFHDVTAGTTNNTCGFTYTSQVGYDLTTGWGTPQCGLIAQLNREYRPFKAPFCRHLSAPVKAPRLGVPTTAARSQPSLKSRFHGLKSRFQLRRFRGPAQTGVQ